MKYILFAAILFFPISTIGAYACDCGVFRPPCAEYGSASAVFIGVVIGDSSIDSQDGEYQVQKRSVSFAVEELKAGSDFHVTIHILQHNRRTWRCALHSARSATIGSTFVARDAGIQQATSATTASSMAIEANVSGSVGVTP